MRSLAAALTAAQRSTGRRPYLKVVIRDRFAGIKRLRPVTWADFGGADLPHGAACAGDGSLTRIVVDAGNALRSHRVAVPSAGSGWGDVPALQRSASRLCAIAFSGANGIMIATDNVTPAQVHFATSADSGATWSAWALAFTHSLTVTSIAVALTGTTACVIVNNGSELMAYKRTGGVWGAGVSSTGAVMLVTGVAVWHSGDWNVIWTGTPTGGGSRLASRIFGDGFSQGVNTWSSSRTIVESAPGTGVFYSAPYLAQPDVFRLTYREQFTGTGAYDRTGHSLSPSTADFASNLWAEPRPLDRTSGYGLAIAFNASYVFVTSQLKYVGASATADGALDVTADVVAARLIDRPYSGVLGTVDLDNSDGAYTGLALLTEGVEVRVSPGYYDANNNALKSDGPAYWVGDIEYDSGVQPPVCRLHLGSVWAWLARFTLARALQHAAGSKSLFAIAQDLLARVGPFEFASSGSSAAMANLLPSVAVPPGVTGAAALGRLNQRSDDVLYHRGEFVFANQALPADGADETYRYPHAPATAHPVTGARVKRGARRHNHVRVLGGATGTTVGESLDYEEILNYYAGPLLIADRELTAAADAVARASAAAREIEVESRRDMLTAPVHCGLEVNDVIDLQDSRVGGAARKARVRALMLRYQRGRSPTYEHLIELGEP